jgi:hypothetical protein
VAKDEIDPIGVVAMSAATAVEAEQLSAKGSALQGVLDDCADLVPGEPRVTGRINAIAGNLSHTAGWARQVAQHFVQGQASLGQILSLGYWLPNAPWDTRKGVDENLKNLVQSDEFGAVPLGVAAELLNRYRVLTYPGTGAAIPDIPLVENLPVDDVVHDIKVVRTPNGFLVPVGSSGDPNMKIPGDIATPGWENDRLLVVDPKAGGKLAWADAAGTGLFVVGAGLTLWGSYDEQWDRDRVLHPDWSTGHRIVSAAANTAVVGGASVAGAWAGAEAGAEGGAEVGAVVGTFVGPEGTIVGGVAGGIVGGVAGGFVGSKAGHAVGTALKDAGGGIAHGATKVWHSIFG